MLVLGMRVRSMRSSLPLSCTVTRFDLLPSLRIIFIRDFKARASLRSIYFSIYMCTLTSSLRCILTIFYFYSQALTMSAPPLRCPGAEGSTSATWLVGRSAVVNFDVAVVGMRVGFWKRFRGCGTLVLTSFASGHPSPFISRSVTLSMLGFSLFLFPLFLFILLTGVTF